MSQNWPHACAHLMAVHNSAYQAARSKAMPDYGRNEDGTIKFRACISVNSILSVGPQTMFLGQIQSSQPLERFIGGPKTSNG